MKLYALAVIRDDVQLFSTHPLTREAAVALCEEFLRVFPNDRVEWVEEEKYPDIRHLVTNWFLNKDCDLRALGTHVLTPEEWAARGEAPTKAALMLVHDGGDLAPYCNYDYQDYAKIEEFRQFLDKLGYYCEQGGSWYSGIYPTPR